MRRVSSPRSAPLRSLCHTKGVRLHLASTDASTWTKTARFDERPKKGDLDRSTILKLQDKTTSETTEIPLTSLRVLCRSSRKYEFLVEFFKLYIYIEYLV